MRFKISDFCKKNFISLFDPPYTTLSLTLGKISPVPESQDKIDANSQEAIDSSINTTTTDRQTLSLTFSTGADKTQSLSVILSFIHLVAHIY